MRRKLEHPNSRNRRWLFWIPVMLGIWWGNPGEGFSTELPSLSDLSIPPAKVENPPAKSWGRDPFVGPPRPVESPQEGEGGAPPSRDSLSLSAVITRNGEGVAIINNEIVRKGDRILDKRVVDIRRDRVILQDESGRVELKIEPPGGVR